MFRCPRCGGQVSGQTNKCVECGLSIKNLPRVNQDPPGNMPPGTLPREFDSLHKKEENKKKNRDLRDFQFV